jgi:hypothetical protein
MSLITTASEARQSRPAVLKKRRQERRRRRKEYVENFRGTED